MKPHTRGKLPLVFMLEQDPDDSELTDVITKESGYEIDFRFFTGQEAFLNALVVAKELPKIIILSYNSIPQNAIQVLLSLKANNRLTGIPVIVLSDIATEAILQEVYLNGASSFITKPFTNADTINKISGFLNYWFNIVLLPSAQHG